MHHPPEAHRLRREGHQRRRDPRARSRHRRALLGLALVLTLGPTGLHHAAELGSKVPITVTHRDDIWPSPHRDFYVIRSEAAALAIDCTDLHLAAAYLFRGPGTGRLGFACGYGVYLSKPNWVKRLPPNPWFRWMDEHGFDRPHELFHLAQQGWRYDTRVWTFDPDVFGQDDEPLFVAVVAAASRDLDTRAKQSIAQALVDLQKDRPAVFDAMAGAATIEGTADYYAIAVLRDRYPSIAREYLRIVRRGILSASRLGRARSPRELTYARWRSDAYALGAAICLLLEAHADWDWKRDVSERGITLFEQLRALVTGVPADDPDEVVVGIVDSL